MSYTEGITKQWPLKPFGFVVKRAQYGVSVSSKNGGEYPMLRMSNIGDGKVNLRNLVHVSLPTKVAQDSLLFDGDFLFNRTNSLNLVGKAGVFRKRDDDIREFVFASYLVRFFMRKDRIDPAFASEWFETDRAKYRLRALATPGVSQSNINPTTLRTAFEIPLPPLSEQRRVVKLLSTWNDAIQNLENLLTLKAERKRALMYRLLNGRDRLHGFSGEWKERQLGEMVQVKSRPTPKPNTPFLSAGIRSHCRGVFLKPDFVPEDIALTELFELNAGDLVVNITFAWEGAVAIVPTKAHGALVSHRFPTYVFNEKEACPAFFKHLIQTKRFRFDCGLASPGGAGRNRVLNKKDFLKIKLQCPGRKEQAAIAEILNASDHELDLHRRQLAAMREQKRGLMQKLLTGEIRVKS